MNSLTEKKGISNAKRIAREAGFFYLLFVISAGLSQVYLNRFFVPFNAQMTAENILSSQHEFLLTFFAGFFGHILCFLILALLLHRLLEHVHPFQARLMLSLVIVSVSAMFIILIIQLSSLFVLTRGKYFWGFSGDRINEISTLFLHMRFIGEYVIGLFWGLWLFPLSYLVYHSKYFPRALTWLLVTSGIFHIIDCILYLTNPLTHAFFTTYLSIPIALGELTMMLYLLIKGVKTETPEETVSTTTIAL